MSATPISSVPGGIRIKIHAQPGAKTTEIVGVHGDALKIRVQAPPIDGRANDELIRFLASVLEVTRSRIKLVKGDSSRKKSFVVLGVSLTHANTILLA